MLRDMLKIIKHEFFMSRILIILSAILAAMSLLSMFMSEDTKGGVVVAFSLIAFFAFGIFGIAYFLSAAGSFYHGIFGKNAYLTHSLPISLDSILLGKVLVFVLWAFVPMALLFAFDFLHGGNVTTEVLRMVQLNNRQTYLYTGFLSIICMILHEITYIFMIAALVHKKKTHVMIWGIVYYFGIKVALNIIFSAVILNMPESIIENLDEGSVSIQTLAILPQLILAAIYYIISRNIIKKSLSL